MAPLKRDPPYSGESRLRVLVATIYPHSWVSLDEQAVREVGVRARDMYLGSMPWRLRREGLSVAWLAIPGSRRALERWRRAEEIVRKILAREAEAGAFFEGAILSEVARWCPERWPLFVSSSMPVRDLDSFALGRDEPLSVFGNRGASGIDGIVSTACGVALATGRRVVAVLGDLALIHDMNGLLALREEGVRMTLVVVQNDGGGIFHLLPIRDHEPEFTRYFATPHGLEVARVAALYDLVHLRVEGRDRGVGPEAGLPGLRAALGRATDEGGSVLVEVRTDRNENQRRHGEIRSLVRQALES
jgi:2-succinyl-5-enolpyruvyl-6-hydroxy-3-cyclohexene-1-carboxylate synthase